MGARVGVPKQEHNFLPAHVRQAFVKSPSLTTQRG